MAQTEFLTLQSDCDVIGKKEEIWLSPLTQATTPTEKLKKQCENKKNTTNNFDYPTIADQLGTVSLSNDNHPTGVVKPVYGNQTFQLHVSTKAVLSKGHTFKNL